MSEFVALVLGVINGTVLGAALYLLRKGMIRPRLPYQWRCPVEGCAFFIEANDIEIVDRWASHHERCGHV